MDLCNPKEIKALLGRHGFHFSKSTGQNFLIQSWVPQQAAEASAEDAASDDSAQSQQTQEGQ